MSDHISGPRALADPIADITDLYAFPSPAQPQTLVLVMNTLPFAQPSDLFSDGPDLPLPAPTADPAAPNGYRAPFDAGGDELVIDCVFSDPTEHAGRPGHRAGGHLHHRAGQSVSFRVGDPEGGSGPGSASSPVCAGTRSSWTPARR